MLNFRRFLSRKFVYAGLCTVVLLALLTLLDPFVRQSIFGPQIDGIPWCVWEQKNCALADGTNQRTWLTRMLESVGMRRRRSAGLNLDARAVLPVYMQLADDSDAKVRQFSLRRLEIRTKEEAAAIMPIFQRHLDDSDAKCRLAAASALWCLSKDRATIAVILPLKDHAEFHVQTEAVWLLQEMAASEPSLFEHLAPLCTAADIIVRDLALQSMRHFGKRSIPILRKALHDHGQRISNLCQR